MPLHMGLRQEIQKTGCSAPCYSFRSGYVWYSNYWTTNWWAIGFCYWGSDKSSTSSHALWCASTSAWVSNPWSPYGHGSFDISDVAHLCSQDYKLLVARAQRELDGADNV